MTMQHHWRVIHALLLVLVGMVGWQIYGGAQTAAALDVLTHQLERMMATLTFSKTLDDGTVVTYPATQQPGETMADFAARARAEWAAICAGLGN